VQLTKLAPGVNFKDNKNKLNKSCEVCKRQNRVETNFLLVNIKRRLFLNLFIVICGDLTEQSIHVVLHIF